MSVVAPGTMDEARRTPDTLPALVAGYYEEGGDHEGGIACNGGLTNNKPLFDAIDVSLDEIGQKRSRSRSCVPEPDHHSHHLGGDVDLPPCDPTGMGGAIATQDREEGPSLVKKPSSRLVQMHLDFGQSLAPKLCPSCGLLFDVCDEDQSIHRRICGESRKSTAQPVPAKTCPLASNLSVIPPTVMLPLGHLMADIRLARSAGAAATNVQHNPPSSRSRPVSSSLSTTSVSGMARRPSITKGGKMAVSSSSRGCDMDLLAALQPGSAKVADLSSSQSIEAASTGTIILPIDSRAYYLFDLGTYASWADQTEKGRPTSNTLFPYLCALWGACSCSSQHRIMLIVRLPQSDEITDKIRKEHGANTPLVEVVGSIRFDANATRVHEPQLYTDIRASIRTLLHVKGVAVSESDVHPYAYHPQDTSSFLPATPPPDSSSSSDGGLQKPLCWRDDGYVRSRRLHGMSTLIPVGLHSPHTLLDISGVHFQSGAFGPKKAKRSIMDLFGKKSPPVIQPPPSSSTTTPSTAKAVVPLFEAALGSCMHVCGVGGGGGAHLRVSSVCAVADGYCDVSRTYHEPAEQFVSSVIDCWEEMETMRASADLHSKLLALASSEGVDVSKGDEGRRDVQTIVNRRMTERPIVNRFSPRSECSKGTFPI